MVKKKVRRRVSQPTRLRELMDADKWSASTLAKAATAIGPHSVTAVSIGNLIRKRPAAVKRWHEQVAQAGGWTIEQIFGEAPAAAVSEPTPQRSQPVDDFEDRLREISELLTHAGYDGANFLALGKRGLAAYRALHSS